MSAVSEIMSHKDIIALRVESTPSALDAIKLMIKNRIGSVAVVDIDGKPIGIITERDVLKKVASLGKSPGDVAVQDIMSFPVITVKAYDSIETAAGLMARNKIKRLIVLEEDGSLAGMLSVTDIARKLAKILAAEYNRYGYLKAVLDL